MIRVGTEAAFWGTVEFRPELLRKGNTVKSLGAAIVEIRPDAAGPVQSHLLQTGSYVLGSSAQCDVSVGASRVSRRHLQIDVLADGGAIVRDLGSRNGTRHGQRRITEMALTEPTRLLLGDVEVMVIPDSTSSGVVGLPESDPQDLPVSKPVAPSRATQAPGIGWALIHALDNHLDRSARGAAQASVLGGVLGEWTDILQAAAMCIRRNGPDGPILAAAGEPAKGTAGSRFELECHGMFLQMDFDAPRELSPAQELALRVGMAALAPSADAGHGAQSVQPGTGSAREVVGMVSACSQMRDLYALAARVAAGDVSVLIRGESGVGKELLATWVHRQSPRNEGTFLAINCAALPAELLEAEIFGIERGVATGVSARAGLLERARGGTVFLDELGDMAASTQAKILRALESSSIYRVGGSKAIEIDVRFVAATHQDLQQQIVQGEFRLDLYHRLAAVELEVLPLRERREDIALLATHFLAEELARLNRPSPGITDAALAALIRHDWPGNTRELRNEMARAALLLEAHQALGPDKLSARVRRQVQADADLSMASALARAESEAFAVALAAARDDHTAAMELLQLPRSSYFRRLRNLRDQHSPGEEEVTE